MDFVEESFPNHDLAECGGSIGLHSGKDVLVNLHREGHTGVAEAFADHLDRYACLEQECGVGVTQIAKPDPGEVHLGDESLEGLGELVGVKTNHPGACSSNDPQVPKAATKALIRSLASDPASRTPTNRCRSIPTYRAANRTSASLAVRCSVSSLESAAAVSRWSRPTGWCGA